MTEQKFEELQSRASSIGELDTIKRMETAARVRSVIDSMKVEGQVFTLTDEEVLMLTSFRRFKLNIRKDGAVFTWQTRKPAEVEIVEETALIVHPSESIIG